MTRTEKENLVPVWEHRRCSHRAKAKTAENPSTVRFLGGLENKK